MKLQVKFKTPGYADCDIEIRAKGFLAASLYWADKDGPLSGWSAFAVFPIEPAGNVKYRYEGHRAIPGGATHIVARCVSPDFYTVAEDSTEIPEDFRPTNENDTPVASFTVMSDLHLSGKPGKICRALQAAESPILIPGDLVNDGFEEQFRLFQQCLKEYAFDRLVLSVTGNHDQRLHPNETDMGAGYADFQKYLFHNAEMRGYPLQKGPKDSYAVKAGEVEIIGLQCVSAGRKFGFKNSEQLNWLENHLNETDSVKWHIILCHAPLLAHNPQRNDGPAYYDGNDELQKIIDAHNHIIFISGHTHFSPDTKQGNVEYIPENQTIYINDGSVAPTELKGEALMMPEWHDGVISELKIYENVVEITYKSFHTGMRFPRGYYRFIDK